MIFLIFSSSFLLVLSWFKEGLLMGSAESGLPFNDLAIHFEVANHAWATPLVGNATGMITASAPTYWLFYKLESLGMGKVFLQFLFFLIIVFISQLATYIFLITYFKNIKKSSAYLGSLFYVLNPLLIFIAWNRFLLAHMALVALIPSAFLAFYLGLKRQKQIYALLFALTLTLFSYVLAAPAFVVGIWGFIFLFGAIFSLQNKQVLFFTKYFALSIVFFILLNFWWIFLTAATYFDFLKVASSQGLITSSGNLSSLTQISSADGNLSGIFRLSYSRYNSNTISTSSQNIANIVFINATQRNNRDIYLCLYPS